jgi:hypothetical protein
MDLALLSSTLTLNSKHYFLNPQALCLAQNNIVVRIHVNAGPQSTYGEVLVEATSWLNKSHLQSIEASLNQTGPKLFCAVNSILA